MDLLKYAKLEIEYLLKASEKDSEDEDITYLRLCADSALKAYENLVNDNHSGMSIGITMNILNTLVEGKTLTPIEDTDDVWNRCSYLPNDKTCVAEYQCKRMSSLFKEVYEDGTIKYHDNDRVRVYTIDNPTVSWHNGLVNRIISEIHPIIMPYSPTKPIRVYAEEFLTDPNNGDYDTTGLLYLILPDGTREEINRFFKDSDIGMVEISKEEYDERKNHKIERL